MRAAEDISFVDIEWVTGDLYVQQPTTAERSCKTSKAFIKAKQLPYDATRFF